ncbi:hypothetical protein G4B88_030803 [Cannabis sativa]|uniref:Uncharacterized protein n=1 Tax=Cannabis sativa TaxID=3483 RepID=A0A7J6FPE2_CANSA|nr:hypothetical protein G4B88_030803 [Cannabis sativa]
MAVELQQSDSCCLQSSQYIGEISALSLLLFPHRLSSLPYLCWLWFPTSRSLEFISGTGANSHLVVGCSDNSVLLWDMSNSSVVLHVQSPG